MSNRDFYRETFDQISLDADQISDLLHIREKNKRQEQKKLFYNKKAWVAAAVVLLLFIMVPTAYAGIRYQWFSLFFINSDDYATDLKGLAECADTEQTVTETDDFKLTILGHLYSKEQERGIVIASLKFKTDQVYLPINGARFGDIDGTDPVEYQYTEEEGREAGTRSYSIYCISKDGVFAGNPSQLEGKDPVCLEFYDSDGKIISGWAYPSYKGEKAEDGGYLIGIRYGETLQMGNTMLFCEEYLQEDLFRYVNVKKSYDPDYKIHALAKCHLPKAGKIPCRKFSNGETTIYVTPIAVVIKDLNLYDPDCKLAKAGIDEGLINTSINLVVKKKHAEKKVVPLKNMIHDMNCYDHLTKSRDYISTDYGMELDSFLRLKEIKQIEIGSEVFHRTIK